MKRAFRSRLRGQLRERLIPNVVQLSDEQLDARLDHALATASDLGVRSEKDLIRYAFLIVGLGPDLHASEETRWMAEILAGAGDSSERLDRIAGAIIEG